MQILRLIILSIIPGINVLVYPYVSIGPSAYEENKKWTKFKRLQQQKSVKK